MHGDFAAIYIAKKGCISYMIRVSMGQHDELEISWLAASLGKAVSKLYSLASEPGIDQDVAIACGKKATVHSAEIDYSSL